MKINSIIACFVFNIFFISVIIGQDYKRSLKEDVYVNSTADRIELVFAKPGKYVIYQGASPKNIEWNKSIAVDGSTISFSRSTPRPFYAVVTPSNDTLIVAERKLVINDLSNFRDLGGIKNVDGKYVAWGKFYRSAALNNLLTSEFPYLGNIDLKKVFDLRSDSEIKKAKDNLPKDITYEHFPVFDNKNSGLIDGLEESLRQGTLTKVKAEELLANMYKSFADNDSEKFNHLVHQIMIEDKYPNVFHCTAGKDRTGYTAALILAILKVDRETILDEYEMTNFYTEKRIKSVVENVDKLGYGNKISPEAVLAIMSVNKDYLRASFDVIDNKYGGIDSYIKNQLGISDEVREKLIEQFTY